MIASWLAAPLAAGFAVVALYCATSLVVRGRPLDGLAATEANHVLMAIAMTVMLLPGGMALVPLPAGVAVFAVLAGAWLVVRLAGRVRESGPPACCTDPVHLVLLNVAMVAMYAVMGMPAPSDPGMAGMDMAAPTGPAAPAPAVAAVCAALALYLVAHAARSVVVGTRSRVSVGVGGPGIGVLHRATASPGVRIACQTFMGAGMGLMLVLPLSAS